MKTEMFVAMMSAGPEYGSTVSLDQVLLHVLAVVGAIELILKLARVILDDVGAKIFEFRLALKTFMAKAFGPLPVAKRSHEPTRETASGPHVAYVGDEYLNEVSLRRFRGISSTKPMPKIVPVAVKAERNR
jgi:hypothetical protein